MTPLPTLTNVTDSVIDAMNSQAVGIAQDVAIPAARFAAAQFLRTRVKSIVLLLVVTTAMAVLFKRWKSSDTFSDSDRPSFDGVQESVPAEERA